MADDGTAADGADIPDLGDRFGLVGVLGRGGMATVWLAEDRLRNERVALKVLHGHLAAEARWRRRLRREIAAASRVRHPAVLAARELHEHAGRLFLSLPVFDGGTLEEAVGAGPLSADELDHLARALIGALAAAHRVGVVHRDVSPRNVLWSDAGDAALVDFGLASLAESSGASSTAALGTAGFAAPEIVRGVRTDPRSDLYGLGATLYFAASGAGPFADVTAAASIERQIEGRFTPLGRRRPELPERLTSLVDALLASSPSARPQTASEAADWLDGRRPSLPVARPRAVPTAIGAAGLPAGDHTVIVEELREDRKRRRAARRSLGRRSGEAQAVWINRFLAAFPGDVRSPEQVLAAAVAAEANLPADALAVTPNLFARSFRLVEGVSEVAAARLARSALEAGFDARITDKKPLRAPTWVWLAPLVLTLVWLGWKGLDVAMAVAPWLSMPAEWAYIAMMVAAFFLFSGLAAGIRAFVDGGTTGLPLAYRRDLRLHLAPHGAHLAGALSGHVGPPPVHEVVPPDPVPPSVIESVRARLAALLDSVAGSGHLPGPAASDLRATVRRLETHVGALEGSLGTPVPLDLAAIGRIDARLVRLETLRAAGRQVDPAELASLRAGRAAHEATIAAQDELEARRTRAMAELLEIGAAADRARLGLAAPRGDLSAILAELAAEVSHAEQAIREVEGQSRADVSASATPSSAPASGAGDDIQQARPGSTTDAAVAPPAASPPTTAPASPSAPPSSPAPRREAASRSRDALSS